MKSFSLPSMVVMLFAIVAVGMGSSLYSSAFADFTDDSEMTSMACGDGVCSATEDAASCAADCPMTESVDPTAGETSDDIARDDREYFCGCNCYAGQINLCVNQQGPGIMCSTGFSQNVKGPNYKLDCSNRKGKTCVGYIPSSGTTRTRGVLRDCRILGIVPLRTSSAEPESIDLYPDMTESSSDSTSSEATDDIPLAM